MDNFVENLNTS